MSQAKDSGIGQQERRRALVDATMTAIAEQGFSNLTLAHIAGLAGLTAGIVNFYFSSKEALLLETVKTVAEEFEQTVSGLFPPLQGEDYHRLSLALYSAGYGEEAAFVDEKYVTPAKTLTPGAGIAKAQEQMALFNRIVSAFKGGAPAAANDEAASKKSEAPAWKWPFSNNAPADKPVQSAQPVKQAEWPKNTSLSRVVLKNGRSINGCVAEKDDKGLWLETSPGSKVYFSKSEYTKVEPLS